MATAAATTTTTTITTASPTRIVNNAKYKVVVLGDDGVGKTSLLARFKHDTFDVVHHPTVGHDLFTCNLLVTTTMTTTTTTTHNNNNNNKNALRCRMQIWDTASRFCQPSHWQDAVAVVVVYSAGSHASWLTALDWIRQVRNSTTTSNNTADNNNNNHHHHHHHRNDHDLLILLVANKVDLPLEQHQVTANQVKQAMDAKLFDVYGQVSAKAGYNVKRLFRVLAHRVLMQQQQQQQQSTAATTTTTRTAVRNNNNGANNSSGRSSTTKTTTTPSHSQPTTITTQQQHGTWWSSFY